MGGVGRIRPVEAPSGGGGFESGLFAGAFEPVFGFFHHVAIMPQNVTQIMLTRYTECVEYRGMVNVTKIIDDFGGATAFARAIGVAPSTASEMKRRKSIPVRHWPVVLSAARERGINLDSDALMSAHITEPQQAAS